MPFLFICSTILIQHKPLLFLQTTWNKLIAWIKNAKLLSMNLKRTKNLYNKENQKLDKPMTATLDYNMQAKCSYQQIHVCLFVCEFVFNKQLQTFF